MTLDAYIGHRTTEKRRSDSIAALAADRTELALPIPPRARGRQSAPRAGCRQARPDPVLAAQGRVRAGLCLTRCPRCRPGAPRLAWPCPAGP